MPPDRLEPLLTDDPIVPLRNPVPLSAEKAQTIGCIGLALVGLVSVVGALMTASDVDGFSLLIVALSIGVPAIGWQIGNPRARVRRRFARAAPGHPFRIDTDAVHGHTLVLPLTPDPAPTPFDPADPAHLDAAATLRRCRLRDGLGFEPGVDEPDAVALSLRRIAHIDAPLDVRIREWITVARFLEGRPDARSTWLAAMACAETDRLARALRALGALYETPGGEARARVALDWLAGSGPRPARAAAALRAASIPQIDALLAGEPGPVDETMTLMDARWRLDPDPAQLDRWLADPDRARALAALPLPDADPGHWARMASHPLLDVAAIAVRSALGRDRITALGSARVLLDRDDAHAALTGGTASAALFDAVNRSLERLGYAGETYDLPRLGRWTDVPGLGRRAERHRRALEVLAGRPESAGGLMMAGVEAGVGGLSPPDELAGALSADHSGEKAKG